MAAITARHAPAANVIRIDIRCSPMHLPNLRAIAPLGIRSKTAIDPGRIVATLRYWQNLRDS
jgi:hypothetical protein